MDIREFLKSVPFFADTLGEQEFARLAAKSHFTLFRPDTTLMQQEDFGTCMYVIESGRVRVEVHGKVADREVVTLGPGEIVGEMALFTGSRRRASVVAETNVNALEIPKAALEQVLARAPELIDRFGAIFAARNAELREIEEDADHFHPDEFGRQVRSFFSGIFGEPRQN